MACAFRPSVFAMGPKNEKQPLLPSSNGDNSRPEKENNISRYRSLVSTCPLHSLKYDRLYRRVFMNKLLSPKKHKITNETGVRSIISSFSVGAFGLVIWQQCYSTTLSQPIRYIAHKVVSSKMSVILFYLQDRFGDLKSCSVVVKLF